MKKLISYVVCCLFFISSYAQKKTADSIYILVKQKAALNDCANKREALGLLRAYEIVRKSFPSAGIVSRDTELMQLANNIALTCNSTSGTGVGSYSPTAATVPCRTVTIRTNGGGGVTANKEVSLDAMLWSMLSEIQQKQVVAMLEMKDKLMIETVIAPELKLVTNDINSFFKMNKYDIDFYKKVYDKTNMPSDTNFKLKKEVEAVIKEKNINQ